MKHTVALFAALSIVSASIALAAPPKDSKKPDAKKPVVKVAKVTDVWTCPVTGEKITDHSKENGKPQVVGNYKVHFCCGGCPETFAKMSDKDKKTKAAEAAKKDVAKTDGGEKKGKS